MKFLCCISNITIKLISVLVVSSVAMSSIAQKVGIVKPGAINKVDTTKKVMKYPAPYQGKIIGMAATAQDIAYVWFNDKVVSAGSPANLDKYVKPSDFVLPPGKVPTDIVGMAMWASDYVYTWYRDGTLSHGTSTDLDKHSSLSSARWSYTLAEGKSPDDIVGIVMGQDAQNPEVFVWYRDFTLSSGTPIDLDLKNKSVPYTLPAGKSPSDIVGMGLGAPITEPGFPSYERVHTWYKDGTVSLGTYRELGRWGTPGHYVPGLVLYRWWGPGPILAKESSVNLSAQKRDKYMVEMDHRPDEPTRPTAKITYAEDFKITDAADLAHRKIVKRGVAQSPPWSKKFEPGVEGVDPMVAVGNNFIIVSQQGRIAFFDRNGNQLETKNGISTNMGTADFFGGFLTETNADGSFNEENINLYTGFPKPCDSPDFPQTRGNRFCVTAFYDTRVIFDPTSKRFFINAGISNPLWDSNKGCPDSTNCFYAVSNDQAGCQACCTEPGHTTKVPMANEDWCKLVRRYQLFAISKTEDPRDGFHQYILTENNVRDWPWISVNGNALILGYRGSTAPPEPTYYAYGPVMTVISVEALKKGVQHPPYFRYYKEDFNGIDDLIAPAHHGNTNGMTFLLARTNDSKSLNIYAFPEPQEPWTKPPLLEDIVDFTTPIVTFGAVYRNQSLYLTNHYWVSEKKERLSIRVARVPLTLMSSSGIQASNNPSLGFVDQAFGGSALSDAPGDLVSYEEPSIAVNKYGDMLIAYGRYPVSTEETLIPEARYTLWYHNDSKPLSSNVLQKGIGSIIPARVSASLDYTTAVVDPTDDTSFWVALEYVKNGTYKTVIGKVKP